MDVSDPKAQSFIFNIDILEKEGAWGLFHELGHNRQRSWWSKYILFTYNFKQNNFLIIAFDGTGEVTVNIFTLYTMDTICHLQSWIHSWLNDQIPGTKKYIENGSNYNEWKEQPGVALFIYAQLIREYGWDNYKAVFRSYEKNQPKLNSNQDKIDHWIITFSQQVQHNLVPLFKFWGFPISQSVIDKLSDLEIPSISDIFIDQAPERYNLST